jgi:hypothetical protein
MTSLQGYVKATYDQLVEVFGEPDYLEPSADGKVDTEWYWVDEQYGPVTVYDWKQFDGGATSRSGNPYRWHIGGSNRSAVDVVANALNKLAHYA